MSKKIILATVVCLLIVSTALYLTRINNRQSSDNQVTIKDERNPILFLDNDKDGLKDWEEGLWKTNPEIADTDDDGTSDFDEIRAGRNPLIKGPDDKLASITISSKINPQIEADLSETDKFSREWFAKYIAAKQAGDPINVDQSDFLIQSALNAESGTVDIFSEADFQITGDDEQSFRKYGNTLGAIFNDKNAQYPEGEMMILDNYQATDDPSKLADLSKSKLRYQGIKEEMAKMAVPKSLVADHTVMINMMSIVEVVVDNMRYIDSDPLRALGWVSIYPDAVDLFINSLRKVSAQFSSRGIIFKKGESGLLISGGV
ncbi:MAG: hypothetical protein A3H57_03925 [Candidatus Taylorbacteria bacterium RIFCSPLOWO2_02_FULL_43_11]|uniref:Uncharacterized protein n=1 Tax=Candidatus Taylorbacteria bacterium RIFCSPHIGHO2_02_FULL_43_32b TaxID=1802306 RepID=A0A1G2MM31_9BACT|nr:MAG: hypothetical protein A2743_01400 [Candidatus Taylorbacteria bacterium RIFCSPHIGHO2_01_FULL_43_47]OHA24052.1 MAG: hypothetical protein A3C72_02865 [Candidatus Taylorbacteria bacterium RIFCSPHIGHO2_02_FULL_43_32b]OHA31484.1 MAG: hypothetical protein A3B08_00880 [Candidatus Taylorbacteria bacterium RIFCSPLOWO2_01_FULL_43_44]OHA37536.1 MAG: hypothetical protein A3H57_03925 [Candidatus Taylorbacteria bacterium RIFCSPLOWO2_02_FULL_43_11]